jgi:hypothetical protein
MAIRQHVVSRWLPTVAALVQSQVVMWDLWWTTWYLCSFPLSTLVFPASSHSTKFSILI